MDDNTTPVLVLAQPTVKDQLVATAIGLGSMIVMFLAFAGFGKLVEIVELARLKRKAKKLAKAKALLEQERTQE